MAHLGGSTNGHATDEAIDVLYSFFPGVTPTPQPLREAAFSLTLKGHLGGQEALLTARGMTPEAFKANLQAIKGLLDPVQPPQASGPSQGQEGWCSTHQVPMKLNDKEGRSWWSHYDQAARKWCKGRG
jgi:hypothetical protein